MHINDISVHLSDPKFIHLPDANTVFYITCDSYIADETHLTLQNSDPSYPDCPGHPAHFQP